MAKNRFWGSRSSITFKEKHFHDPNWSAPPHLVDQLLSVINEWLETLPEWTQLEMESAGMFAYWTEEQLDEIERTTPRCSNRRMTVLQTLPWASEPANDRALVLHEGVWPAAHASLSRAGVPTGVRVHRRQPTTRSSHFMRARPAL
jgi:hypothetical protein